MMRSGYSSRILLMSRVPMPDPVPPPREWVSWKPCRQSPGNGLARLLFVCLFCYTFSHLADAFIQSDLQGCIHILYFTLMAHCTSGAIRGSVSCSRTLRQGIELATF